MKLPLMSYRPLIVLFAALSLVGLDAGIARAQGGQVAADTSTPGLIGHISHGVYISPTGMFRIQVPVLPELGGTTTDADNGVVTFQDSISIHISVGCFAMDATQRWTEETQGRKDYLTNFITTIVGEDFVRHFPGAKLEGTRYKPKLMDGALFAYVTLPNGTMFTDRAIMSDSLPPVVAKRGNLLFVKDEHVYVISMELSEKVLQRLTWDKTPEQEDDILDDRLRDVLDKIIFTKPPQDPSNAVTGKTTTKP
jgi:hypothetical protein